MHKHSDVPYTYHKYLKVVQKKKVHVNAFEAPFENHEPHFSEAISTMS